MNIKIYFFVIFLCLSQTIQSKLNNALIESIIQKTCCSLFGNKEVSIEVQKYFNDAAQHFNLNNQHIPIRYVQNTLLDAYSSFSWFGIWINKNYWIAASEEQKIWTTYHEMAHLALGHPPKFIISLLLTALFSLYVTRTFRFGALLSKLVLPSLLVLTSGALSCVYEKQADIFAAQMLCRNGKKNIVEAHIKELLQEKKQVSLWFYSSTYQAMYLKDIIG